MLLTVPGTPDATAPARYTWAAPVALVGLFAAVFAVPVVNSIRIAAGVRIPPPTGWADQLAAIEGSIFSAVVVLIVVCRWLPRHAPDVTAAMGLRRSSPGRTIVAALAYVVVAAASAWIGSHLADGVTSEPAGAGGKIVGIAASISAGVTEEVVLLALTAAVVHQVLRDRPRLAVPVTLAVLVVLRWSIHLQYGWASLFVLVWIPAAYLLFRRAGSIWPLVIGHAAYDIVLVLKH